MKKAFYLLLASVSMLIIFQSNVTANASYKDQMYADTTVYKMKKGNKPSEDTLLKYFTIHKGTWLKSDKYSSKYGGWIISTSDFHSGKYVYYIILKNNFWSVNEKSSYQKMPHMLWQRKVWGYVPVYSSPKSSHVKFYLNKYKHTIWTVDYEAKSSEHNYSVFYHIRNGHVSGWVWRGYLKFAPHRNLMVQAPQTPGDDQVYLYNNPSKENNYPLTSGPTYNAIQFKGSDKVWVQPMAKEMDDYGWTYLKNLLIK